MSTPTPLSSIPHIHLLAVQDQAGALFTRYMNKTGLQGTIDYTVHEMRLAQLNPDITFDLVVSPANSYGLLDGAFDDAISCAWSPVEDYFGLTRAVQGQLYEFCRGYLPPGQCFIAAIPHQFKGRGRYGGRDWGCRYIGLCPTMRYPQDANWDREVVYECVWSLLTAIVRHNRSATAESKISSILMTPLATGVGRVPVEKWAQQATLAMKHFVDAERQPEKWTQLNWPEVLKLTEEIDETHGQRK